MNENAGEMRCRYMGRVGPLLELVGVAAPTAAPDFSGFDESSRRPSGSAPETGVVEKVRGDLNRAFLMD